MSEICYSVKCFNNKLRYTHSIILALKWAKEYNTEVYFSFNVPKILIEDETNEKNLN